MSTSCIRIKSIATSSYTLAVENELVSIALGTSRYLRLANTPTILVWSISTKASPVNANAFEEEKSIITDIDANSGAEVLPIRALGLRNASFRVGINSKARNACGTLVYGTRALSTVRIAWSAASRNSSES